jgi:cytochrome bd ubiquinol oxidase subunit I
MTPDFTVVDLSRLQFAITALYHFLFVPLTIGLGLLLAIMESVYVMTGREIWRRMVKFWGVLFGINFAMGVATGITMEFQFGTNWAYYSHYVGDVFGAPLAIEGMVAFFLEATFIGLFFMGWERLSKIQHLVVTWLLAIGANLSALWILIANGWMQYPVGATFNPDTMRMELTSFWELFFNPVAQEKFVHTVSASYVTGAVFVMAISAYYVLKGRNLEFARRSMTVAASFGLASALSVVVLGDESGYTLSENQKMKIAAIEAMWETQPAPAGFTLFGIPDQDARKTHMKVEIPAVLGLITTRSFHLPVAGISELVAVNRERIVVGLQAYAALERVRADRNDAVARAEVTAKWRDLGFALLLKRYRADVVNATPEEIDKAAWDTVPHVWPLFWSFRIMVGLGLLFIAYFAIAFYLASRRKLLETRWMMIASLVLLPTPWIAAELGWIVAEYGRQPWVVDGILPTFLAVSNVPAENVIASLIGFVVFYTALAVADAYLMTKYARLGPDGYFAKGAPS